MRAKNLVLLSASLLFYAWGEPAFVLMLVADIAGTDAAALAIDAAQGSRRSLATAIGVGRNLALAPRTSPRSPSARSWR